MAYPQVLRLDYCSEELPAAALIRPLPRPL